MYFMDVDHRLRTNLLNKIAENTCQKQAATVSNYLYRRRYEVYYYRLLRLGFKEKATGH
jgi:hypothetical protein